MLFEHHDYRSYLKAVFDKRAQAKTGYSLRAFADKLEVSNSFLSEVLNSKKALSVDLAFRISLKLNLTPNETQYLCMLAQLDQEKNAENREDLIRRLNALKPQKKKLDLSAELFKTISEWYHLAILELTYISGFEVTAVSVAKKLGISTSLATLAIERLLRLDLLQKNGQGQLKKTDSYILSESKIPNEAFKAYHRQILEKAIASLTAQDPSERMSATDILAMDSKHLPEVDRLSQEFSAAVLRLSAKSKVKDGVYALTTHFFHLSKERRSL